LSFTLCFGEWWDLTPHYFRWAKPRDQVTSFTVVVYFIDNPCAFVSHQLFSVSFITLIIDNFTCHVWCSRKFHRNLRIVSWLVCILHKSV
jgi:hypothetical protein